MATSGRIHEALFPYTRINCFLHTSAPADTHDCCHTSIPPISSYPSFVVYSVIQLPVDLPPDLTPLLQALQRNGVEVRIAPPPRAGVYGLYESGPRRLWVAPITDPLGILRQTFIHETVHAVQACPKGRVSQLGVNTVVSPVVAQSIQVLLYTSYSHGATPVEREAFEIQGRADAVPLLLKQFKKRCLKG